MSSSIPGLLGRLLPVLSCVYCSFVWSECLCVRVLLGVCVWVCVGACVCACVCVCVCVCGRERERERERERACAYVCACVRVCTRACVLARGRACLLSYCSFSIQLATSHCRTRDRKVPDRKTIHNNTNDQTSRRFGTERMSDACSLVPQ